MGCEGEPYPRSYPRFQRGDLPSKRGGAWADPRVEATGRVGRDANHAEPQFGLMAADVRRPFHGADYLFEDIRNNGTRPPVFRGEYAERNVLVDPDAVQDGEPDEEGPDEERSAPIRPVPSV
jgi:hypothetical protein